MDLLFTIPGISPEEIPVKEWILLSFREQCVQGTNENLKLFFDTLLHYYHACWPQLEHCHILDNCVLISGNCWEIEWKLKINPFISSWPSSGLMCLVSLYKWSKYKAYTFLILLRISNYYAFLVSLTICSLR